MKVRQGFVSNSSTSSYLVYGTSVKTENEFYPYPKGMAIYGSPYSGSTVLGYSWDTVGDDETGRQFKMRVENAITAYLQEQGFPVDSLVFSTHEDAWYNG